MSIFLARNAHASRHNLSPYYDDSRTESHSFDMNYNALPEEKYAETKTRETMDSKNLALFQSLAVSFHPL